MKALHTPRSFNRTRTKDFESLKVLLLVTTILLICYQLPAPALAQTSPPQISLVNNPSSVNVGQSFQVSVKLSNIFEGSEAKVEIFDPSAQMTLVTSRAYSGTPDGTVGVALTLTAPSQTNPNWCLKAVLEYRTLMQTAPFEVVDQSGFCMVVSDLTTPTTPPPTTPPPPVEVEVKVDWAIDSVRIEPEHLLHCQR